MVKLFGEHERITTAILAALIGTIISTVICSLPGQGLIAALYRGNRVAAGIADIVYHRLLKSLVIAGVIWVVASVVGWILPALTGPL